MRKKLEKPTQSAYIKAMKLRSAPLLSALLILSFITAGISPACQFMSGGAMALIEICKADGSVETIEVPAEQAPFQTADTQIPIKHPSSYDHDCMACFASSPAIAANTPAPALIAALPAHYLSNGKGLITPQGLQTKTYLTTGPPSFFV